MKRKQATLKTRKSLTGPFRRKKDDDDDADDDFRPTKAAAKSGAKKGAGPGEPLKAARAKLVKKEESDVDVDDFDYVKPAATTKRTAAAAAKKKPESDDDAEEEKRKAEEAKLAETQVGHMFSCGACMLISYVGCRCYRGCRTFRRIGRAV